MLLISLPIVCEAASFTFNGYQVTGNIGTNYVSGITFNETNYTGGFTISGDLVSFVVSNNTVQIISTNATTMELRPRIVTGVVATTVTPRFQGDWMLDVGITGVYFAIGTTTNDWRVK